MPQVLPEQSQNDPRAPVAWPLDTPLSTVAVPEEQLFDYRPRMSRRATGDDATKLRTIRTTSNLPSSDGLTHDFTRITATSAANYSSTSATRSPSNKKTASSPPPSSDVPSITPASRSVLSPSRSASPRRQATTPTQPPGCAKPPRAAERTPNASGGSGRGVPPQRL